MQLTSRVKGTMQLTSRVKGTMQLTSRVKGTMQLDHRLGIAVVKEQCLFAVYCYHLVVWVNFPALVEIPIVAVLYTLFAY